MAALYDVKDTVNNKIVMKDRTAHEIADKFGMFPGNIRRYSDAGFLVRRRYLVINTYTESKSSTDDLKEQWEDVFKAAQMIKNGTGKIKRVQVNGKYVLRTVPV